MLHKSAIPTICALSVLVLTGCTGDRTARDAYYEAYRPYPYSYIDGILAMGTEMDRDAAIRLTRRAAEAGDLRAQVNLAFLAARAPSSSMNGAGTDDFFAEAAKYRTLAGKGDLLALTNLGLMCISWANYPTGPHLCASEAEGVEMLRRASDAGFARATVFLGYYTEYGYGDMKADRTEAARLYRLAASRGEALGAVYLEEMQASR